MQISLTKKLADALGLKLSSAREDIDPLFSWTANWTTTWENRRAEDLIILVNNATRFTVAIYQVKRKNLMNVEKMMLNAIENTLLSLSINPEMVKDYMDRLGKVEFTKNQDRKASAWVSRAGLDCALAVARQYTGHEKVFNDEVAYSVNYDFVNHSGNSGYGIFLYRAMINALTDLTGKEAYDYQALELLVTLDLEVYQAQRRIIVPANLKLKDLHRVLQHIFNWRDYHLYDFIIMDPVTKEINTRLVPYEQDLEFDETAILIKDKRLSEFFPKFNGMTYTYDMGDYWQHHIELVRIMDNYQEESPYLVDAIGQAPPEDVGGVGGFLRFREIMLDKSDPEYEEFKQWAGYWDLELSSYDRKPKSIHIR